MSSVLRWVRGAERGQTMIFFAILSSALFATCGMAIEGGRSFVEFRRLQSAADMAAVVGAQGLPCTTADTTCITNAETLACTYATNNGFSGCTAGGSGAPSANVPPTSCSPYDFIDYGNGASNGHCQTASSPTYYSYIEVKLTDNLGTVPIFNVPVTLSAHAVAKRGPQIPGDFTMMTLDPNTPLNVQGSGTLQVTGSVFGEGGISGNSKQDVTCQGGWYSPDSISGVKTDTSGTPIFSPPGCTGSNDSTADAQTFPQQSDPYAGGSVPPTQSGTFTNCTACAQSGYWYDLNAGKWYQGGSPSGDAELFPGIYSSLSLGNSDKVYFNPGVYTFTAGFDTNHGDMCVYGAPDCEDGGGIGCSTDTFTDGSTGANQWYYACSPYGFWDSNLSRSGAAGGGPPVAAPTFTDGTTPLNGVTIYLPSNSGGITVHGNSGKNGDVYLAAPNPCPGTGTYTTGSTSSVSMPAGSASAVFTYTSAYANANDGLPHGVTSSTAGVVYPSYDFSLPAECTISNLVWPNEMLKPQHLHFLFDIQGPNSDVLMNGASGQQFTGIWYAPTSSVTIRGAGKGGGGPPWIDGQMIMYDGDFSGNSYNDVVYRPCGPGANSCGSGLGSQLVE